MGTWERPIVRIECEVCHEATPDYLCWTRQEKRMCERCFGEWLKTAEGKAYETWFARDD